MDLQHFVKKKKKDGVGGLHTKTSHYINTYGSDINPEGSFKYVNGKASICLLPQTEYPPGVWKSRTQHAKPQ